MNKKRLFGIVIVALSVWTAQAQVGPTAITLSTNRVTAATTNSTAGSSFDVGGTAMVNIGLTTYATNVSVGAGDATATYTLRFYGSIDDVTYYQDGTNLDCSVIQGTTNSQANAFRLTTTSWKYLRPTRQSLTSTQLVVFPTAVYFYK